MHDLGIKSIGSAFHSLIVPTVFCHIYIRSTMWPSDAVSLLEKALRIKEGRNCLFLYESHRGCGKVYEIFERVSLLLLGCSCATESILLLHTQTPRPHCIRHMIGPSPHRPWKWDLIVDTIYTLNSWIKVMCQAAWRVVHALQGGRIARTLLLRLHIHGGRLRVFP